MLERHDRAPLLDAGKHLHKNLLRQILLAAAPWEMPAHNADDQRPKPLHQRPRRRFIARDHPRHKTGKVWGGLAGCRHGAQEGTSYQDGAPEQRLHRRPGKE